MCVEVGRGDPLPPKTRLLTSATESALTVEVEVIYHSKPARSSSGSLYSQKHVANRLPMARASGVKRMGADSPIALAPVNARGGIPSDGVLDEVNLASPVGVKPPVPAHDAVYVLADSVLGYNNALAGDVGGSTGSLESSDGAHHVLNSSSCSLDHSDGSLYAVIFDADFAPEMDGTMLPGYLFPLCINRELLLTNCFEVAVGAALYVAEAGMAVHGFWNPAAVLLRGHVRGGPALLLMVPPGILSFLSDDSGDNGSYALFCWASSTGAIWMIAADVCSCLLQLMLGFAVSPKGDFGVQFLMIVLAIEQKILVDPLSLMQLARSLVVAALAVNRRTS
ncbi:hypothetical protein Nepgr_008005 [Nepenthes gracilis]|uniref:Uncharacterized protein n=1 Tax=Nepenthes gracilis TaxID=150966 RepID=A0AAD3XIZ7_NEPGR|nr:hypothetical protein Nepgr_008005 [Nepenthes gracilis]